MDHVNNTVHKWNMASAGTRTLSQCLSILPGNCPSDKYMLNQTKSSQAVLLTLDGLYVGG